MPATKLYETVLERLDAYLKSREMRQTLERKWVLEQVCRLPQPFTAEQLRQACEGQRLSRATIYNTLELLLAANILHAHQRQVGQAATEYELTLSATSHMTIICHKCGRQTEIHDKSIATLIRTRKYSNFNLQHYSLFLYGEYKLCRRKIGKR